MTPEQYRASEGAGPEALGNVVEDCTSASASAHPGPLYTIRVIGADDTPGSFRVNEGADMAEHMDTGGGSVVIAYMVFCIWGSIVGLGVGWMLWGW